MKVIPRLRKHFPFVSYILLYIALLSHKLITNPMPFFDWDESIYSQVGIEMINRFSLVPSWQGVTWLDKPPLVPLYYGTVIKLFPFIQPEISVRISTLLLSVIVFSLLYALYFRVIKEPLLPTVIVAITSVTPIFLQRSQLGNIDVFLLLGWVGYILFYERFWISLCFLAVAVLSKSLVGFYPVGIMGIYFTYQYVVKKIDRKKFLKEIKKLSIHAGILLLWYVVMLLIYGKAFFIQHVYESHFKRVTDSIESHFGKRTFYIDLLFEQFGLYVWFSLLGLAAIFFDWYKNKFKIHTLMYATFFLPWFLFLNVTKTKIFWYGYPYIPQFVFLFVYPLMYIKRLFSSKIYNLIVIALLLTVIYQSFIKERVQLDQYASYDDHHKVAQLASKECSSLHVLNDPASREAIHTLESMDLTITTTRWWGQHPSMVYYYGKPVEYIYDVERVSELMVQQPKNGCIAVTPEDISTVSNLKLIQKYDNMSLYKF